MQVVSVAVVKMTQSKSALMPITLAAGFTRVELALPAICPMKRSRNTMVARPRPRTTAGPL